MSRDRNKIRHEDGERKRSKGKKQDLVGQALVRLRQEDGKLKDSVG